MNESYEFSGVFQPAGLGVMALNTILLDGFAKALPRATSICRPIFS